MKTNVFLLLALSSLSFSQQLSCMQKDKSKFIVECVLGKKSLRGYGEEYTSPTAFKVIGLNAKNSNNIDAKILFALQNFTQKLEQSAQDNTTHYFRTEHNNKHYTTKVIPYMSMDDKTLLQVRVLLLP